jgi:hypothetical protein
MSKPRRELVRPSGSDVLDEQSRGVDPGAWARILPNGLERRGRVEVVVRHEGLSPPAAPVVAEPSRAIPWALIAVAFFIALYAVFAAWHSVQRPQLVPVHQHHVSERAR